MSSNFDFLKHHDELLVRLAETAEHCFVPDPNTTLIKMRQLGEALAKAIAARVGIAFGSEVTQYELLRDLDYTLRLDRNIKDAFHSLRKLGNDASHDIISSTHRKALESLQVGFSLSAWYHQTFGGDSAKNFKPGAYKKPKDPSDDVRQLEETITELQRQQKTASERLATAEQLKKIEASKAEAERKRAQTMAEESKIWEALALETEAKLEAFRAEMDAANTAKREQFEQKNQQAKAEEIARVEKFPFQLSEAETRVIIDLQLNEAGWEADTKNLRYANGSHPLANQNRAIAEWPTDSGPTDYVLFMGLTPVAVVEAKKHAKNVYSALDQSKRYAKGLKENGLFTIETSYGEFKVPLVFATNGRPYLKQLEQESGIWFLDVRNTTNRRKALQGWYTPHEIKTYLRQTPQQAEDELESMDFNYDLKLRDYQVTAIRAVEQSIRDGKDSALVAMATGTGKTKTCIALIYRLLKAERFRRVLFLVDRAALGKQATVDFQEVRLENLQTFADTFELKELGDKQPDDNTKVHVATVQGLVQRILYPNDNDSKPGVGQYDCIVVDECHRGYLLDKDLSETEILFRNQKDYQSKYRAVIDYFDAFKVGLTATPALHTTDIFGKPVFTYSYPEAVLDGWLNDHLPPIRIHTKLSEQGIRYEVNDEVQVLKRDTSTLETFNTPDELEFDVADFNRKVRSISFTKTVCKWLIESGSIDPYLPAKTLIFCVTDQHADQVVEALKSACEAFHGEVEDDAIQKITGTSDKPLDKIIAYKNDRLPNVAVTVDLLTTGIDVRPISNLVFLRRVNSRILFEQMLGRATRLCPEIGKGPFRIYDAVNIYEQLENVNTMKPVVTRVDVGFTDLSNEMIRSDEPQLQQLAKDQFIAKLQVKKNYLSDNQASQFETVAGETAEEFAKTLKNMPLEAVAEWFKEHPGLGEILDAKAQGGSKRPDLVISHHEDEFTQTTTGYGDGQKPEDYLQAFTQFINANSNRMAALQVVVQRPWELSRQSLKELAVELDRNQFREQDLQIAWNEVKSEDIAARIIGFIRQAALGEALIPWEQRVDQALVKMLALKNWSTPQRQWLERVAKQMKAMIVVDEAALNQGVFKQNGGISRANKLFDNAANDLLQTFNQALWQ
ncbi:type I restriction-modification system endonuclease [Leucothrix mucor]|uniref:type I restriction-modification system endonuclease n=1 Tax=Leucothrix mucor TaxID=45248 RepID=UPI0003B4A950|nr:type I restriction-modification system endonuclease [Leucothrix mucor]